MPTTDPELDALEIIQFFLALAEQDAALVACFLKTAGLEPGTGFPRDVLFKLALYCRLALWEDAGLETGDIGIPSAQDVFLDALTQLDGHSPRLDVAALGQRIHLYALQRLTWPQISGGPTFLLDDQADATDVLDGVADLLWNFRHLADATTTPTSTNGDPDNMAAPNQGPQMASGHRD